MVCVCVCVCWLIMRGVETQSATCDAGAELLLRAPPTCYSHVLDDIPVVAIPCGIPCGIPIRVINEQVGPNEIGLRNTLCA